MAKGDYILFNTVPFQSVTKEVETNVRRFCTPDGHIEFATSLWFEGVVGHRALPEELIFM